MVCVRLAVRIHHEVWRHRNTHTAEAVDIDRSKSVVSRGHSGCLRVPLLGGGLCGVVFAKRALQLALLVGCLECV